MTTFSCTPISLPATDDLPAIRAAFSEKEPFVFGQAWLSEPEAGLQPTEVRAGWQPDALCVLATLTDRDIFNTASRLNDETWTLGDVFEVFIKQDTSDEYFEFHITPENQLLQLRFAHREALGDAKNAGRPLSDFFITDRVLDTRVWVDQAENRWTALVRIPFTVLSVAGQPQGTRFRISFCRYDYTRGAENPQLSSASPYTIVNYHRQDEWLTMQLDG